MEFIAEVVLQFLGELLIQLIAEVGVRSVANTFQRFRHPVWSLIGFTIWGAALGGISLLFVSHSLIDNPLLREINLFVTPVAAGLVMALIGRWRLKKGQDVELLDRFGYAFTFAFAMAFVRYNWAA